MIKNYKNSYKVAEKELVSLSVYNVGFQKCDPLYQWGPGIRDHYLIHYIISGRGYYKLGQQTYELNAGDTFLVYPNTEVTYYAAEEDLLGICMGRLHRKRRLHDLKGDRLYAGGSVYPKHAAWRCHPPPDPAHLRCTRQRI